MLGILRSLKSRAIAFIVSTFLSVDSHSELPPLNINLEVTYIAFATLEGEYSGPITVKKWESLHNTVSTVKAPYLDQIVVTFCDYWMFGTTSGGEKLVEFNDFAAKDEAIQALCRTTVPAGANVEHDARICHPGRNLVGVTATVGKCTADSDQEQTSIYLFQFYYIYRRDTKEAFLVDSASFPDSLKWQPPFYKGVFNGSGTLYYYAKHGTIFRYDLSSLRSSSCSEGSCVMVPANSDDFVAYTEGKPGIRLYGEDLKLKTVISVTLGGYCLSAYNIGEGIIVAAVRGSDGWSQWADLYLLNFSTGTCTVLCRNTSAEQILSATRK